MAKNCSWESFDAEGGAAAPTASEGFSVFLKWDYWASSFFNDSNSGPNEPFVHLSRLFPGMLRGSFSPQALSFGNLSGMIDR
jgi:hypothetical protein